jgi:hypothetical protein
MRFTGIGLLVLATILSVTVFSMHPASAAGSRAFCGTWLNLCNRTCPGGAGMCGGVCTARYNACLSSGCFFFNTPGPRCQAHAADQAATTQARNRMKKGLPVGCGPGFGRPC